MIHECGLILLSVVLMAPTRFRQKTDITKSLDWSRIVRSRMGSQSARESTFEAETQQFNLHLGFYQRAPGIATNGARTLLGRY